MAAAPDYDALAKELKRKLREAAEHAERIGKQDEEFERLAKMNRKDLAAELRTLRKELTPKAVSKMAKHELVNEIIRVKLMIDADVHVPHTKMEVDELHRPAVKGAARKVKRSATEAHAESLRPKRKGSPLLALVAAKRKEGMSLKDAWAAVKAGRAAAPERKHQAPNPHHVAALEAVAPKSHAKMDAQYRRAKEAAAARVNPVRAQLADLMKKGHSFTEAAAILKHQMEK